jgi:2-polyprenyl-6-methoxyphenol hydroxylase-like FAD-dependent oxidoreductase
LSQARRKVIVLKGKLLLQTVLADSCKTVYPQIFIDRQAALQILFKNPKYAEHMLTNKRVFRIEHEPNGVRVFTKDGSTYKGDFIVGADGIHSTVRLEMWRMADEEGSGVFNLDPLRGWYSLKLVSTLD